MPEAPALIAGRTARGRDRADRAGRGPRQVGGQAGAGRDRRPGLRAQAPRPGAGLDHAGLGLPARRAAGAVGTRHPGPPARLPQPADRGRGPGAGAAAPCSCTTSAGGWCPPSTSRSRWTSTHGSCGTWPPCTRPSGTAGTSSTSSRPCTATWSCRRGWPRRRPPRARRTWCRELVAQGWPLLAEVAPGRGRGRRPRWPATRARWWRRWPRRRRRSCTATGSSTTSAPTTRGARCCSTGSSPGAGRRLSDLAWYLAINCRRLPQSKEASIAAYREALEGLRHRHRALVGPPAGAVPARRPGPVRLGEGARRLRRGTRMVGNEVPGGGGPAELTGAELAERS